MSSNRPVSENRIRLVILLAAAQFFGAALPVVTQQAAAQQPPAASRPAAPALSNSFTGSFRAYAAGKAESRVSDFSGLPVPRYSSLKYNQVNGRAGPSLDYPVQWNYARAGLPVVIVRETQDWRKIRDPQGDEAWVHRRVLGSVRTAMTTDSGTIRRQPDARSGAVARYEAGAVVTFGGCEGAWCRVEADNRKGWAPRTQLWGADDLPDGQPER
jgi:SH3-like domain-containing protein